MPGLTTGSIDDFWLDPRYDPPGQARRLVPSCDRLVKESLVSFDKRAFEQAGQAGRATLVGEFFGFVRESRKWWLIALLLAFLLFAVLIVLASTGAAPFIYTLF